MSLFSNTDGRRRSLYLSNEYWLCRVYDKLQQLLTIILADWV
jgi:hypothetical protein